MTLVAWQSNKDVCEWARKVFTSETGRQFIAMLKESHPLNSHLPPVASDSVKSTELGKLYGYEIALNNMLASQEYKAPVPELAETYGAERK